MTVHFHFSIVIFWNSCFRVFPSTVSRPVCQTGPSPFGQKTRPCPEPEMIALRTLVINQVRAVFGRFPASLIYVLIVSPSPAVPSILSFFGVG
jgi:hypothetical protein